MRRWSTMLVTAGVTAMVLIALEVAVLGLGDSGTQTAQPYTGTTPVAPPSRGQLQQTAVGPEGVPVVLGSPLGPASSPARGKSRAGVPCGSSEQVAFHVHAHLAIFVNGFPRAVPLGVG